jgi:hypothetical protein
MYIYTIGDLKHDTVRNIDARGAKTRATSRLYAAQRSVTWKCIAASKASGTGVLGGEPDRRGVREVQTGERACVGTVEIRI